MRRSLLLASALVLALVAPTTGALADVEPPAGLRTTIYLLADQPEGGPFLIPVHRDAAATLDLPAASVMALLAGPTEAETAADPGMSTAIPSGVDLLALTLADGIATVDVTGNFDDGGGSASMFGRLAQLVYTLTRFDGIDSVLLQQEGEPVEVFSSEGIVLDGPLGRAWFTDTGLLPAVLLDEPAWNAPFAPYVEGRVDDASDRVTLHIADSDGRELGLASLVPGIDGHFWSWLPFDLPTHGLGTVSVQRADGTAVREHLVRFAPEPVRDLHLACPVEPAGYLSDVSPSDVHGAAIACAANWRMMVGRSDRTFQPASPVTRAQVASTLVRLLEAGGAALPAAPALPFEDVAPESTHAAAIAQLTALGIIEGITSERFAPAQPVSRGQVATLIHRSLQHLGGTLMPSERGFGDDDASEHERAVEVLSQLRLVAGTTPVSFDPDAPVLRGQLASIVARTVDLLLATGHARPLANVFDVYSAAVGDVVAGLPIVALEVSQPDAPYLTAHVGFGGELTVSGTVTAFDDDEQLGDAVCVTSVTSASERSIPRMLQDTRYQWFCFTNSDVARAEVFSPGTATATTVVIDQFTIHHAPTEMWNTARLLHVDETAP